MATSVTVANVLRNPDGSMSIEFSDGQGQPFEDVAAVQSFADTLTDNAILRSLIAKRWIANSPTLADDSSIEGKTFTLNPLDNTSLVEVSG